MFVYAAAAGLIVWNLWPPSADPFFDAVADLRLDGYATSWAEFEAERSSGHVVAAEIDQVLLEASITLGSIEDVASDVWPGDGPPDALLREAQRVRVEEFAAGAVPFVRRLAAATSAPQFGGAARTGPDGLPVPRSAGIVRNAATLALAVARFAPRAADRIDATTAVLRLSSRWRPETRDEADVAGDVAAAGLVCLHELVAGGTAPVDRVRERVDAELAPGAIAALAHALRGEIAYLADAGSTAFTDSGDDDERAGDVAPEVPHDDAPPDEAEGTDDPGHMSAEEFAAFAGPVGLIATLRARRAAGDAPAAFAQGLDVLKRVSALPADDPHAFLANALVIDRDAPEGSLSWVGGHLVHTVSRAAHVDVERTKARVALVLADRAARGLGWPATAEDLYAALPDDASRAAARAARIECEAGADVVRVVARGAQDDESSLSDVLDAWTFRR